ncbi:hypothetical protein GF361_04090 [Candidatus Woesearchaeota archaeon]|nr:hypothetical protein [Candidatus Woesearchaeota archaeon]
MLKIKRKELIIGAVTLLFIILLINLFLPEQYITVKTIRGELSENVSLNLSDKYNYLSLILQNFNCQQEENITKLLFNKTQISEHESLFYDELYGTGIYSYKNLFSEETSLNELSLKGNATWVPGGGGSISLCKDSSIELFVKLPFNIQTLTIGDTMVKNNLFYFEVENDGFHILLKKQDLVEEIFKYQSKSKNDGFSKKITTSPDAKEFSIIIKPIINSKECIQMYSLLLEGRHSKDKEIHEQKNNTSSNKISITLDNKSIDFSESELFIGENSKILMGLEKGSIQFLETFNDPQTIRFNTYERTGIISKTEEEYGSIVLRPESSITYLIKSPLNITSLNILRSPTESNMFVLTNGRLNIEYSFDLQKWINLYSISTNDASPLNPEIPPIDNINQDKIFVKITFDNPGNGNQAPILQMYNIFFSAQTLGLNYKATPKKIKFSPSCTSDYLTVMHKDKNLEEKEMEEIINGYYGSFSVKGKVLSMFYKFLALFALFAFLIDYFTNKEEVHS